MKRNTLVVIATGIYPPTVGGPAYYAYFLAQAFRKKGVFVNIATYGFEKRLPSGVRHLLYGIRLFKNSLQSNVIISLDTYSVGLPAVVVGLLLRKKVIIRVGGDFLWEHYVERNHRPILLKDFYCANVNLSFKEKVIFFLTKKVISYADTIVFSTKWQMNIWHEPYNLSNKKVEIIENYYDKKVSSVITSDTKKKFVFLWAGRDIFLKNISRLRAVIEDVQNVRPDITLELVTNTSHEKLLQLIEASNAVIVPSLSEVSPNFVLEALMYNKPVLLTKENGLRDRLGDFVMYFDPLNVNELKEKVLSITDAETYNRYQKNIANMSLTHSYDDIAKEFIALLS